MDEFKPFITQPSTSIDHSSDVLPGSPHWKAAALRHGLGALGWALLAGMEECMHRTEPPR